LVTVTDSLLLYVLLASTQQPATATVSACRLHVKPSPFSIVAEGRQNNAIAGLNNVVMGN